MSFFSLYAPVAAAKAWCRTNSQPPHTNNSLHAARNGVLVQQDMIQKFGNGDNNALIPTYFRSDITAMVDDLRHAPSVMAFTIFNEGDCVSRVTASWAAPDIVNWLEAYDPTRLVDTNSGGPANALHVGHFNDLHDYPYPVKVFDPAPWQLRSFGEFGGIGAFIDGKEWVPQRCHTCEFLKKLRPAKAAASGL